MGNFNECYQSACEHVDSIEKKGRSVKYHNFSYLIDDLKFDIDWERFKLFASYGIDRKQKAMKKRYYANLIEELKKQNDDFIYTIPRKSRSDNRKVVMCLREVIGDGDIIMFRFEQTKLFPTFYLDLITIHQILKEFRPDIKGIVIQIELINMSFEAPLIYEFTNQQFDGKIKESCDLMLNRWNNKTITWIAENRLYEAYSNGINGVSRFN